MSINYQPNIFFRLRIIMLFSLSTTNALFVYLPSPAEELYFGSLESGEKKTLIVLTNVTKNIVAFKVKQTNKQTI